MHANLWALLPFPFFLASFICQILSIESPSWAIQHQYAYDSSGTIILGNWTRGVFHYCPVSPKDGADPQSTNPNDFLKNCSTPKCVPGSDPVYLCQQLDIAGNFLIAGTTFTALTMCLAMVVFVVVTVVTARETEKHDGFSSWTTRLRPRRRYRHESWGVVVLTAMLRVFAIVAIALGGIATWLGTDLLVNNVPNDGDYTSSLLTPTEKYSHWMVGKGAWLAFAGWMSMVVGFAALPPTSLLARSKAVVDEPAGGDH